MAEFLEDLRGKLIVLFERSKKILTRIVTAKADEKAIRDDDYISPPGHVMFLKNHIITDTEVSGQLVSLGGTKMEDGRTWGSSQDLMSRTFSISNENIELGNLTSLKSFQVTSSHKNRTCSGSSIPRLTNAASCDLEPPESNTLRVIMYGGQSVDTGLTSDILVKIEGEVTEDIGNASIDVTRYPSAHKHFTQFEVPAGWPDGSHLVQLGEIPEGRTGSRLNFLKKIGSSDLLVSIGGHSKPDYHTDYHHPESSISVLLVPEMRWWKLPNHDCFKRSFHSQTTNSAGNVYIMGGMSMRNGKWATIHALTQVVCVQIKDDFTYSLAIINIIPEIEDPPYITNFSYCASDNSIFIYSGFCYPDYSNQEENLYKFQPPIASRNKLPKFSDCLFKIDLDTEKLSLCANLNESGCYNGSIVCISSNNRQFELMIHADPKIILYSDRILESPKCDLPEAFGSCSLGIVEKKRDTYECATPVCMNVIHLRCDKSLRGKAGQNQFCPTCRHLDPATWKPYPGAQRPRVKRR